MPYTLRIRRGNGVDKRLEGRIIEASMTACADRQRRGNTMPGLSEHDARARLSEVPGWDLGDKTLVRKLSLPSFGDAVAFVVKLAFVAEAADHHPDILINYRRVTLTLWTHTEGGITEKDFALAKQINKLLG
jgi:4a-hydroxytetrahydrobiopterin dehydratase